MHVHNWVTVRLKWDILWGGTCTVCKDLHNWRLSIKIETHPNYGNQQQTPPPLELLKRKSHPQDLANLPSLCPLLSGRAFPSDSFWFWVKCPHCFADLCEPLFPVISVRGQELGNTDSLTTHCGTLWRNLIDTPPPTLWYLIAEGQMWTIDLYLCFIKALKMWMQMQCKSEY